MKLPHEAPTAEFHKPACREEDKARLVMMYALYFSLSPKQVDKMCTSTLIPTVSTELTSTTFIRRWNRGYGHSH